MPKPFHKLARAYAGLEGWGRAVAFALMLRDASQPFELVGACVPGAAMLLSMRANMLERQHVKLRLSVSFWIRSADFAHPGDRTLPRIHFRLNRIGTVKSTRCPDNSGGGGGKGCARRKSASASSSSALAPDERTMRLSITRPRRSRLKKTWAIPC